MKDAKLWGRVNDLIGDNGYLLVATDQGYRESAHLITKCCEPLLIDRYVDQTRPDLPLFTLFTIGGGVCTQVFIKSNAPSRDTRLYLTAGDALCSLSVSRGPFQKTQSACQMRGMA